MIENTRPDPRRIEEIINLKLCYVSRRKDILDLRVATDTELEALRGDVLADGTAIRGRIENWHVIVGVVQGEPAHRFAVGTHVATGYPMHTSALRSIDRERGLLRTMNSLYELGEPGGDEPSSEMVWMVCAVYRPYDAAMGGILGIPEVFL